jgi:hypothetical protein
MEYKKIIKSLPLLILVLMVSYCLYTVATTNIILVDKHYLGIGLVIISVVLVFFKPKIGMYLTGIALFLGTMNFVAYTAVIDTYSFGFSLNGAAIDFKIQLYSLLLLLFFIVVNIREIFSPDQINLQSNE